MPASAPRDSTLAVVGDGFGSLIVYSTAIYLGFRPEEIIAPNRHQMAAEPQAFMKNGEVYRLIRERKLDVLPITIVGGRIVKTDAYPSLAELRGALGAP